MNKEIDVRQRINEYIDSKFKSKSSFSKAIKLPQTTVNNQLLGNRGISFELIISIANELPEVSFDWLLRGKGNMTIENDYNSLEKEIIELRAENKLLRELQGLGERKDRDVTSA